MTRLLQEIRYDLEFAKSHTLQPKWYKVLKVFILLGVLAGYWILFGLRRTAIFAAVFFFLSLIVHLVYRSGTHQYTRSWLDFVVAQEDGVARAKSIGLFYYSAVVFNAVVSVIVSQLV